MLYLVADKYGTAHKVVDEFLEADAETREDGSKFLVTLTPRIIEDIERLRNRHFKILQFVDKKTRGVWEVGLFSELSEKELQEEVNEAIEELNKKTFSWTFRDVLKIMEEKGSIETPEFSVERYKVTV